VDRIEPLAAWLVVCVASLAVAGRAWLLFRSPYIPGVNGAYYLVQARALIERGALGLPDLPLTFYLHAATAWVLSTAANVPVADAIVLAVKLCDAALPPLIAWPVFVLVRRWAASGNQGLAVPLAAATLACLASPFFRVVGDLQKNSLALVWLALLAVTLHGWLATPSGWRGVAVLATLCLLGLTHIGVLGAAIVLLAAVVLVAMSRERSGTYWVRALPWIAAGIILLAGTSALVFWRFDPSRVLRLMTALTSPATFSADGRQAPVPPGGALAEQVVPALAFALTVVPSLVYALRRREVLPLADVAVVIGGAAAVLAMTGPWFGMDKAVRFQLIALVPAIFVAAFGILHISSSRRRSAVLAVALVVGLGGTVASLPRAGTAILSDSAMTELQSLARFIPEPDHTLVVAPHGAEWWSAWFFRTRVAQASALRTADWARYKTVLFVEVKAGQQMNGFPGGGPPGFGPPRPPPPKPGAAPRDGAPHGAVAVIPAGGEVLHDGPNLRLARVATPPGFVSTRPSTPRVR
jgi:hypothetical protein